MSAVSRKSFSDYFKILNKEAEKNPQNRAKAVVEINRVFESFGFWGTKRSKNLNLNGRIIPIEELTPKELIIFTVFAKKYSRKLKFLSSRQGFC
ncbi:MAG: hypothetical protein HWD61_02310 [Parachlamydiaceae bacterium]|nr:MAG: hypothetical protein HWD61_02310 [Parachlamydiaceae bacterium]